MLGGNKLAGHDWIGWPLMPTMIVAKLESKNNVEDNFGSTPPDTIMTKFRVDYSELAHRLALG